MILLMCRLPIPRFQSKSVIIFHRDKPCIVDEFQIIFCLFIFIEFYSVTCQPGFIEFYSVTCQPGFIEFYSVTCQPGFIEFYSVTCQPGFDGGLPQRFHLEVIGALNHRQVQLFLIIGTFVSSIYKFGLGVCLFVCLSVCIQ